MDDNTTKLLENPHQSSHKTLYLLLVLLLVVVISTLAFLKSRSSIIPNGGNNAGITAEEQMSRLAETPSTGDNPSLEEQDRRLKEAPSTNADAEQISYEEQLEILKNN